ncbi:MAG: tetratricopeptide repeat protein, partial [Chloroflexi bacterium]|nr:tetratricopeptide repeat protein [Chloroflexota bacterium]
ILAQLQGRYPEAENLYKDSLAIQRKLGNQDGIASSLGQMGLLAEAQGNLAEAEQFLVQALEIFQKLGAPDTATVHRALERVRRKKDDGGATQA